MKIKKFNKRIESDNGGDYSYYLLLGNGKTIQLGINYMNEVWIVFTKDLHEVEKVRELFYDMLRSKECIERLKFILINPKDMIFMPSEMNPKQERLGEMFANYKNRKSK